MHAGYALRDPSSSLARRVFCWKRRVSRYTTGMRERLIGLSLALFLVACGSKADPKLDPIGPQSVSVSETLRVPLTVTNPDGVEITGFRFEAPDLEDLPGFTRSAGVSGTTGGGEFRFTPLASHVGTYDITFIMTWSGGEDRQNTTVEVIPAANTAPVFLRPGAGATYDLTRNPCVEFDLEVRDDDSSSVTISERVKLPEGAELTDNGDKTGMFHWCPTPDQVSSSLRYTIAMEATDEDASHPPTEHDYIIVLRGTPRADCPGTPPTISLTAPSEGGRVTYSGGFAVAATASDDMGLRDAPLLYYTTTEPEDLEHPDVTSFDQVIFAASGSGFSARVPSLGLADGEEAQVWIVASATDNDDTTGTACDHQTDTAVVSFTAVGASAAVNGSACDACGASTECSSGVCASAAGGAQCLDSCAGGESCSAGTCGSVTSVDGAVTMACGDVAAVCMASTACTNDSNEPNEDVAHATALSGSEMGQVCELDSDVYSVTASAGTRVDFTVNGFASDEGDLDLQILAADGTILASSASTDDIEMASYCMSTSGTLYARVFGYHDAVNGYTISSSTGSCSACTDDSGENDDTFATARALEGTDADRLFDGTICPSDGDFIGFDVAATAMVTVSLTTDGSGDVDIELLGSSGRIAISESVTGDEIIEQTLGAGHYVVHVYAFEETTTAYYVGSVTIGASSTCTTTTDCPLDTVCNAGHCVSDVCTSTASCPSGHLCPVAGPGAAVRHCAPACEVNSDCRSSSTNACKRFAEGQGCARRGSAANGSACATFADCGGQRACMPWPSGYCARADCAANSECESGTYCGTVSGAGVCVLDCSSTPSLCRSGYTCSTLSDSAGASRHACVPAMSGG